LSLIFRGPSMTPKVVTLSKYIIRASAVLVVAMGASACSTVPDWVDPTTWVGGSDSDQASTPADQSAQTADNNTQTPDLSTIPDKPQTPSTADEQRDVAQSLASDRSKAQYSADALKGGTEPSAAPPPTDAAPPTEELAANDSAAPPPEPAKPAGPPPRPAAGPGTLPADSSADNTAAQAAQQPAAAPAPEVASAAVPPPAPAAPMSSPAVPAVSGAVTAMQTTDSSLGFRPSTAPPLDASVAQFVPPSIMARYAQTASISGGTPAVPAGDTAYASNSRRSKSRMGVGGPEAMSGAVVANFDSLQGGAVAPTAYAGGIPGAPASVVFFPRDTTVLDGEAKAQIREAAKAFLARGGQGYVRVVGHASSGASMTGERQMVWNFERSQARASAVARALIAQGVPADKVLVQAVGDDRSGYDVTAPQGQDGSRRADIIFES
jgi:outer membrane protein OmpA-like peptidoglycan-associated protein